jgi:hypothetical protein
MPRTARGHGGSTSSRRTSGLRMCGRCRRRAAPATSHCWCGSSSPKTRRATTPAPPARSGRSAGSSGSCSAGTAGRRPWFPGADASRPAAGGPAQRPVRPGPPRAPLHAALPAWRRVRHGDRQPDHARGPASRLGPRPGRRLPRPDGRAGEAQRTARRLLHVTWPRSGRSVIWSSTPRCCGRSSGTGAARAPRRAPRERA